MDKKIITFTEATKLLNLSRPTLNRYIASGAIPSYKLGKRRFFVAQELTEWMESHKSHKTEFYFNLSWINKLEKYIVQLEETFQNPEKISALPFVEKARLYEKLNQNKFRSLKFLLKLRASAPEAIKDSSMQELKDDVGVSTRTAPHEEDISPSPHGPH